jgi:hypothetical protein
MDPIQKEQVAAELLRRGRLTPEQATQMGYGHLVTQQQHGFLTGAPEAPDPVAARQAYAKDYSAVVKSRESLAPTYGLQKQLDRFDELSHTTSTGPIFGVPMLGSALGNLDPNRQQMSGIASELQGKARPVGSGATSDFEQRLYRQGVPSPDKYPEANASITAYMRSNIKQQQDYVAFQDAYLRQNKTLAGSEDAWARYVADQPYAATDEKGNYKLKTDRQDWKTYFGLVPSPPRKASSGAQKVRRYNPATGGLE